MGMDLELLVVRKAQDPYAGPVWRPVFTAIALPRCYALLSQFDVTQEAFPEQLMFGTADATNCAKLPQCLMKGTPLAHGEVVQYQSDLDDMQHRSHDPYGSRLHLIEPRELDKLVFDGVMEPEVVMKAKPLIDGIKSKLNEGDKIVLYWC